MTGFDADRFNQRVREALDAVAPAPGIERRVLQRFRIELGGSNAPERWPRPLRATLGNVSAAVTVLVILGGTMGIGLALRNHSPPPSVPAKAPGPNPVLTIPTKPTSGPTPVATAWMTPSGVAYVEPASVSFVDAANGWAVGDACDVSRRCEAAAARTSNGGATWIQVSPPVDLRAASFGLHIVATSGVDAWIWGSFANGPAVFTSTHDGGRSWHSIDVSGPVVEVTAAANTVWALVGCTPGSNPCPAAVMSSSARGGTWTRLNGLPASVQQPVFSNSGVQGPQLVRSTSRAWILNANQERPALVRTDNGGGSWISLPLPCSPGSSMTLGASSDAHVMLACANVGGWPAPQEVWSSSDGGAHWFLRSREGFATFAPPRPDVGSINSGGAPIALVVVSDKTAWLANDREDNLVTHDDGVTWTHAALPQNYFGGGGGAEGLTFGDPQHGWTFVSAGVWATTDGGVHWQYQSIIGRVPGF